MDDGSNHAGRERTAEAVDARPCRERLIISGILATDVFVPWIARYAAKLGLRHVIRRADAERIEVDLAGPAALVDMMEVGCSLGPIEALVDRIERAPAGDGAAG